MDAASKSLKQFALFLAIVLIVAAPGWAQTLVANPNPVVLTGTNQTVTVNVTASDASAIPFTVAITSNTTPGFFVVNPLSGTTPAALTVQLTSTAACSISACNGTFRLTPTSGGGAPVNVSVTLSTTGGGGGGLISVSPTSQNVTAFPGGSVQTTTTISTTSLSAVAFTVSSDQSWLTFTLPGGGTSGSVSSSAPVTLTATANAALAPSTLNTGNITITPTGGGTAAVFTVQLTVSSTGGGTGSFSVSPSQLNFTGTAGGSATASQPLTVTVPTTSTSFTVTVFDFSGVNWPLINGSTCQPNGCTFTGPQALNISANPAQLFASSTPWQATLTIASGGETRQAILYFQVTTGTPGPLTFSPTSFTFNSTVGGAAQSQNLTVSTATGTQWTVSSSAAWLTVSSGGVTIGGFQVLIGSQTLSVNVNPAGLVANTYTANLTFTSGTSTQTVPVTLVVGSGGGGGGTFTIAAPTTLNFAYQTGTGAPLGQAIQIAPAGDFTISQPTASWILLSAFGGTGPGLISVSVNPTGLAAQTTPHTGSFTISTPAGSQTITVNLLVSNSPVLQPSPGDIIFQSPTTTYSLALTASDFSSQTASAVSSASWVTLSNPTISGSQINYFVTINTAGLCNGLNVANITITTSAANNPLVVPVVARVTGAPASCGVSGGTLTANPTSLTFSYQQGAATPAAQTISVTSSTGSPIAFSTSATSTGGWLSVNSNSTTTPATVTVSVSPGQLQPSSTPYTGTITLRPSGTTGANDTTVSVSLTVSPGASITATPTTLNFTAQAGGGPPSTQTINVGGNTGSTFSATATSSGNWLSLTPTSGTAPATLTVSVNPANLTPNATPYTGTITVAGTGTATGSTTITVNVTVTAPLPTITKVGNAASFLVGSLAPGEVIYIEGTAIGPQTLVQASIDSTTSRLATTIGGVSVTIGGFNAPMVYASATKVSAIVPYELKGFSSATVVLRYLGQSSNGITFGVSTTAPGVFTANASGTGPAAAVNPDLTFNSPATPAARGSQVAIYITGEGETNPAGITGRITTVNTSGVGPLTPVPLLPVSVLVDGQPARAINYIGEVAGIVAGVLQVNFTLPDNIRAGDVSLVVSVGGNPSQTGVTISVR